jgi:hypothetical protein
VQGRRRPEGRVPMPLLAPVMSGDLSLSADAWFLFVHHDAAFYQA